MKNYGIEIEIIDKSGKNINGKEFICKINDKEVSENKDGMFLLKEKIEEVGEKNSYKIECADKTINVNVVLRDNNEIDIKKLKLNIIKDGKKVKVADCGGRARNRYWDIDTVFNESKTCNDAHCPFWAISK